MGISKARTANLRKRTLRRLWLEQLEQRFPLTAVVSVAPTPNSNAASYPLSLIAEFDRTILPESVSSESFAVHSTRRGRLLGVGESVAASGRQIAFSHAAAPQPGETLQATVTRAIRSATGADAQPFVWNFRTRVSDGHGTFIPGSVIEPGTLAFGDLDDDGDLDAFATHLREFGLPASGENRVWINRSGTFEDSGQSLGNHQSRGVALGDLDSDGDLDAFVVNFDEESRVWLNDRGVFTDSGQLLAVQGSSQSVALGDVDGDGDLDAFVATSGANPSGNQLWLNSDGVFTPGVLPPETRAFTDVRLGDLDNDGDLDVFLMRQNDGHRVWLYESSPYGGGGFVDSGQNLGVLAARGGDLGDLDGDGDLDVLVGGRDGGRVWLNDGGGRFSDSSQMLSDALTFAGSLGDLDGDGDLDSILTRDDGGSLVWLNDGDGVFTDAGQILGEFPGGTVSFGDWDGDGDLDAFQSRDGRVWLNHPTGASAPPVAAISLDESLITESGESATISVTLSDPSDQEVIVQVDFTGTADEGADFTASAQQILIPPGQLSGELTVRSLQDALDEPHETVVASITSLSNAIVSGLEQVRATIIDDDGPPPSVTLSRDNVQITEARGVSTFSATLSELSHEAVLVNLAYSGTATLGTDYTPSSARIVVPAKNIRHSATIVAVEDELDEPLESVIVEIDSVGNGTELGQQLATTLLANVSPLGPGLPGEVPRSNSHTSETTSNVRVTFGSEIDVSSATLNSLAIHSLSHGLLQESEAALIAEPKMITVDPAREFLPGERINATTTSSIETTSGAPVNPRVWQFRAGVLGGSGTFSSAGQSLGDHNSFGVALGDVDGDGDLDGFVANWGSYGTGVLGHANHLWLNEGGVFTESGQLLGTHHSRDVALGDLDGDGDLDAFVANWGADGTPEANRVWLNNGGEFTNQQLLGAYQSSAVSLGDLDRDGDLDAFVANAGGDGNRVWVNAEGVFSASDQILGDRDSRGVALGDLDGDGDLDAFVANVAFEEGGQPNRVFLNDNGTFFDSGQALGNQNSFGVSLGDLDADGDLDAVVSNRGPNRIWLNEGGTFHDSGQALGDNDTRRIELGDLDADGDLDAVEANGASDPNSVWRNDGTGAFFENGQRLGDRPTNSIALGDLNGDGSLDAFFANSNLEPENTVWLNQIADPPQPTVTLSSDTTAIAESGGVASITVSLSTATQHPVTVSLSVSGSASPQVDYSLASTEVVIESGTTTGSVRLSAIADTADEPDETVVLEIGTVTGAQTGFEHSVTVTILDGSPPATFHAARFTPTASGFDAVFNAEVDTAELNLYDARDAAGPADVVVQGAAAGIVRGSLVLDTTRRQVSFVKSGGPLLPDAYSVTLLSGEDAFKDAAGRILDGDLDGQPGGNLVATFTVSAANDVIISLPDFSRGPGQGVQIPADITLGLPLSISEGSLVRNATVRIGYDPSLLTITAATPGPGLPVGSAVTLDTSVIGTAVVDFSSPEVLPAGAGVLAHLQAHVPINDANTIYGQQQLLDIHGVVLRDVNSNVIPVVEDDALHFVGYFGDLSGNGQINAADATNVARVAALIEAGFSAAILTDPIIVGDISGNGLVNAADAALIARSAALFDVPEIPAIPQGNALSRSPSSSESRGLTRSERRQQNPAVSGWSAGSKFRSFKSGPFPPAIVDQVFARVAGLQLPLDDQRTRSLEEAIASLLFDAPPTD